MWGLTAGERNVDAEWSVSGEYEQRYAEGKGQVSADIVKIIIFALNQATTIL